MVIIYFDTKFLFILFNKMKKKEKIEADMGIKLREIEVEQYGRYG